MSKIVMLNKDSVVIDIVDMVKPVKKSRRGITILCAPEEAEGYVGSDNNTVYAKMGAQFQPTYYDIASLYTVEEIPEQITPLAYKYNPEDGFVLNEDPYPETNLRLTQQMAAKVSEESLGNVEKIGAASCGHYAQGDIFVAGGYPYEALVEINIGNTLVVDGNCKQTNINAVINNLKEE